jgi:hypothetical protein
LQPRVKHVASVSLILVAFTAFSVSLAGIPIPPVGEYLQAFPDLAAFALRHPQEVAELIRFLMGDSALFEWVLQHFDELYHLFSDEAILNLITENDWILPLMRDLYTLDPDFFRELFLDQAQALELLNWLVEHPEYRDLLRQFPALIQALIESGFDEAILTPHLRILTPFPYQPVAGVVPVNLTVYSPHGVRDVQVRWNSSTASGAIACWQDRAGMLSATWDTTPLSPGLYSLTAVAETGNGSQLRDAILVTVASTAQIRVVILAPDPDATVSDGLAIRARVISTTPIARCYSTLRGTRIVYAFDLTGPDATDGYALDVDTGLIDDGPYTLTVVALDAQGYGNSSSRAITITDTPRVTLLTPANHSVLQGVFLVTANVSSVDPIAACTATFTDVVGSYPFPLTESGGLYQRVIATTLLPEGVYDLTVTAVDADGSQNASRVTITVAHPAPSFRILTPLDNATVSGNVTIAAQVVSHNPITECYARLQGPTPLRVNLTDLDGDTVYQAGVDTAALLDGEYNLTVYALDQTGALNASVITIHVQDTPTVTILTPTPDAVVGGTFLVSARVDSVDAVDRCYANLTGHAGNHSYLLADPDLDGVYATTADTSVIHDADYTLTVTAVDLDGSTDRAAIPVRVFTQPTVTLVTPADGETVAGNVSVAATVTSVDAVTQCRATLTNATFTRLRNLTLIDGAYRGAFDTVGVSNGVYALNVSAVDVDGSTGSVQVTVTVATVPALTIDTPPDGSPVYGSFPVRVTIVSHRAVATSTAVLSNATSSFAYPLSPLGGGVYAGLIDSAAYADGPYTLTALVVDALGAQNASQLTLTIDNVPAVTLLAPLDGVFVQGGFAIRADVQSRHPVAQVVAMIDGVAAGNLTDAGGVYIIAVDSTLLTEGAHTVAVVAINDQGDRNATAPRTVHVDNQAEGITFVSPANRSSFDADVPVTAYISDYVDTVEWYVNNWLVATQSFGDAYTPTVTYTVDISNILFPPNVMVVNVRYTSALGHASTSENLVLYKT